MITSTQEMINRAAGGGLRWLRSAIGASQADFCDITGMWQPQLCVLESGKRRLGPKLAAKIAEKLGITYGQLIVLMTPVESVPEGEMREKLLSLQESVKAAVLRSIKVSSANTN